MGKRVSTWRYLTDESVGAAEGLAADEALMLRYGRDERAQSEATLRLYTYRSHCALVGRYQNLEDEVDLEACAVRGVQHGRRPTGGGAILMGAGQLGVAVCTRAPAGIAPKDLLRRYADGVIAGLARLGIDAAFRSKNDLEVGGRKIAGLGLYVDDRGALLFHTSLLVDLDIPLMLEVLKIPGAKLSDKAVERVADRVTTVSRELGRPLTAVDIRDEVRAGFASALGLELCPGEMEMEERDRRDRLVGDKYANDEWIRQRSPLPDARGTAGLKTPEGFVRVYVGVHGDTIKSLLVAGDFNTLPAGVSRLEAALRWSRAEHGQITAVCERELVASDLGVPAPVVAEAIWQATTRALEREREAHPVRAEGSCYFPEQ
ncbi:MAG: lipoate--protein ligase family protein [Candidatus Dormibacteraceae bacterium]